MREVGEAPPKNYFSFRLPQSPLAQLIRAKRHGDVDAIYQHFLIEE